MTLPISLPVVLAVTWVFAATLVAFLPLRQQYLPGVLLLVLAPVVIALLWISHGWIAGAAATAGFVSMFRNPLRYFWQKWRGTLAEAPE